MCIYVRVCVCVCRTSAKYLLERGVQKGVVKIVYIQFDPFLQHVDQSACAQTEETIRNKKLKILNYENEKQLAGMLITAYVCI